jgi:hypothetical protein
MFADLHAIIKSCNKPAAGLLSLAMVDPRDLLTQPDWLIKPTIEDLDFIPGKAAYAIEPDRLTARLVDKTDIKSRPGDTVEYYLSATVTGITPATEWIRAKLLNRRVHIIAVYQNGDQRFIPNMRLYADADSGDKSNPQRYSFSGFVRLSKIAPFFGGTFNVIGSGSGMDPSGSNISDAEMIMDPLATSGATATFILPANVLLTAIYIKADTNQSPKVGLTLGGDELGGPQDMLAGDSLTFAQAYRSEAPTTLFFSGLAGTNQMEIWYAQLGDGDVIIIKIPTSLAEYEYVVPDGVLLAAVWVKGSDAQTVSVGLTSGGDELGGPQDLAALQAHTFAQTLRTDVATSIFISGLTGSNNLEVWYYV